MTVCMYVLLVVCVYVNASSVRVRRVAVVVDSRRRSRDEVVGSADGQRSRVQCHAQ